MTILEHPMNTQCREKHGGEMVHFLAFDHSAILTVNQQVKLMLYKSKSRGCSQ